MNSELQKLAEIADSLKNGREGSSPQGRIKCLERDLLDVVESLIKVIEYINAHNRFICESDPCVHQ